MPRFRATVRLSDLGGQNPAAVQHVVEEGLKKAGFERWRILSIETEASAAPVAGRSPRALPNAPARRMNAGGLLLVVAAAWAIWFFWLLTE